MVDEQKKPCLPHTTGQIHIWTHRLRQPTNNVHTFMPNVVPALRGPSRPRIPLAMDNCWQRGKKIRIPGFISHSPEPAPCPEIVGQHKRNFMFSCCCLFVCCFWGWVLVSLCFFSSSFLFVLNLFYIFVFRETERKNRVHREVGGPRKAW